MPDWMPPLQTENGRLRFFSVSETRLDKDAIGRPIVDSRHVRFAVDENGAVREARTGEVTAFLDQLLNGPHSLVAESGGRRSGEDR